MEEQYINIETAKIAKEKRFNISCSRIFYEDKWRISEFGNSQTYYSFMWLQECDKDWEKNYLRPTQSLLQKWIREVHHVIVEIRFMGGITTMTAWYDYVIYSNEVTSNNKEKLSLNYKTYEDALEAALIDALNLIK